MEKNKVAIKAKHHCYDSYYVIHHFYGRGYWIWIIPMHSPDGETMISIGHTYRPEKGQRWLKHYLILLRLLKRIILSLLKSLKVVK